MGYETTAVVAVNKIDYPEGVDWKSWTGIIEMSEEDDFKFRYLFHWSKRTNEAVEYFISKVVLVDEYDSPREETFGIIEVGEEDGDIEKWGDYWDYDIGVVTSLEIY
jgi:hypothetical protein